MKDEPVKAWQPLTFGGIARYGHDSVGRLFFACLIVSILTASVILWATTRAWFPVLEESMTRLPPGTEIRGGKLTAAQPLRLSENLFLSLRLDPLGEAAPPTLADIQIVLGPTRVQFRSLFGASHLPYRPEWTYQLSRADLEPKWAAWRPAILAYLFFGTIAILVTTWIAFGILYAIPVRILAAILRRSLSLWGAWKLSVAGLIPAAILLTVVLLIYGLGQIRLAEVAFAWFLHFVIGWIFIAGATFSLAKIQKSTNPFGDEPESSQETQTTPRRKNPFKS